MTKERRERLVAFGFTAAVFAFILYPMFSYVPIWDGRVYANCAVEAAASGITAESLRCAGHPSQAWALFLAAAQTIRLGDVSLLHLTDTLLGLVALASIRIALTALFPATTHARQLDLVTLACAVHPILLSTLLQVNVDFGVYVFFFAVLAALLTERFALAALAGVLLCFSKETGVLAYAVTIGLFGLFRLTEGSGTLRERALRVVPLLITSAPLVLFVAHVVWWGRTHKQGAVWKHGWQSGALDGFTFLDFTDPIFLSYAAGLFVIGFMWLVTALLGADLAVAGVRKARRRPARELPGANARMILWLGVLTAVLAYLLTSFRTWSNLRYFALLYPLFVILAFAAMIRLGMGARVRTLLLGLLIALFALSDYRSVDPLARRIYGTFSIGDREMYRMASITGEFNGPGRDQLVYNLEFAGFHEVQNAMFRRLRPTDSTTFATSRTVRWNIWSQLDARTWRRTLARRDVIVPRYADEVDLAANPARPADAWYLEFSNRADDDHALQTLMPFYTDREIIRVRANGHVLSAHHLVRRDSTVVPSTNMPRDARSGR